MLSRNNIFITKKCKPLKETKLQHFKACISHIRMWDMLPLKHIITLLRITMSAICKSTLLNAIGVSERDFYPTWQKVSFIAQY